MQKVIMLLLIIMQTVFITSYFIHSGIVFLTTYFWMAFCIVTFCLGVQYHFTTDQNLMNNLTYRILSILLTAFSLFNFFFILYITFIDPYLYMETKVDVFKFFSE